MVFHPTINSPRRDYADGPFGQIHYRISRPQGDGTAPPLICLHQTPKSGRDFESLMERLGTSRNCVAPDTPGYGDSDAPAQPPSIADYGHSLLSLLDHLQAADILPAGPCDLMGYHTGSVIAAWVARHFPERVRRIIFVSLPALDAETRRDRLANMHIFPTPREDGTNIQQLWALTETLNDARLDPEWRHRALAECLRSGSRMPWGFRAVYDHDFIADLEAVEHPVLLLCPRDDLWDDTHNAVPRIRDARFVPFPDAGNGFLDLDTDQVAKLVTEFLEN